MKLIIIDYGIGNLGSVYNMLSHLDVKAQISGDLREIEQADKLIFPGIGSFDNAVTNLRRLEFWDLLDYKVRDCKTPILGICLGMQLMTLSSEEGSLPGFGWIDAMTYRFQKTPEQDIKIPHMGWNNIRINRNNELVDGLNSGSRFYFIHSYYVKCNNEINSLCTTNHGHGFDSVIVNENIFGCQFHPEKSHKYGMMILSNFSKL